MRAPLIRIPTEPHAHPPDDVVRDLAVDPSRGVALADVEPRRTRFGSNVVVRDGGRSAATILIRQFRSIVIGLLAAAALVAFLTRDLPEGFAILAVLAINAATGFAIEWRSEKALEQLRIQARTTARVLRDGVRTMIDATELVVGDIVHLEAGALVPADARLLDAAGLEVEESALTGESFPVPKSVIPVAADTPLADRSPVVHLGTTVTAGRGVAVVTAVGEATSLGEISRLVRNIESESTPLEVQLARVGRQLVAIVLGAGAIVVVAGIMRGDPPWQMVEVGISLAVAAVPEGLPAVTTLILAIGVLRMARRHAIVRKLPAVETLGGTSVICTDKTGTLTENRLTVRRIDAPDPRTLLETAALCSDATLDDEHAVGDPTEIALVAAARNAGIDVGALRAEFRRIAEEPFDPTTRRMITTHLNPAGGTLRAAKGAPSVILALCGAGADETATWNARNEALATEGLRILAFARSTGKDEPFTFEGFAALADPPRGDAAAAISDARAAGVRVVMLTGDQVATARAIARELHLAGTREPVVAHARELAGRTGRDLLATVRNTDVFARVTPSEKLLIVTALRDAGEVVAVTGDGMNDAPALRKADIGVAMGKSGTDVARQTADLILTDDALGTIVAAIQEGRTIYANISKFVHLMFSHNLAEVLVIFAAIFSGLPLPLLPLQILWINVVTDIFPAFALALEPSSPRRMRVPPRSAAAGVLSRTFLVLIAWQGVMLAGIALGAYVLALHRYGAGSHARTVALFALIGVQLGHMFNCRSRIASAADGVLRNPYVWLASLVIVLLQWLAIGFQPLARILDTTPLERADLLTVAFCILAPIAIVEVQKWLVRRGAAA